MSHFDEDAKDWLVGALSDIEEKIKDFDASYREERKALIAVAEAAALLHLRWRGGEWDVSAVHAIEASLLNLPQETLDGVFKAAKAKIKAQNEERIVP